ncbi:MAG: RNA 2',3'-cyclic phosphodiesterase [Pseudomonadota bacterium]
MPRLFTALEIPSSIALQVAMLQNGLPGARWIDRENLHITIRFMGDVEPLVAREIAYELEQFKTKPFSLELGNLDVFGHSKPHSLYASVKNSQSLFELQASQERLCQRLGLEADSRKFTPHLTIARVRGIKAIKIARYLSVHGYFKPPVFDVSRFMLLSSRSSTGGGPYRLEESYQFSQQETANV